jgi:hypothetical protein
MSLERIKYPDDVEKEYDEQRPVYGNPPIPLYSRTKGSSVKAC